MPKYRVNNKPPATIKNMGDNEPGTDAFTCRRSRYFWKHKAAIGFGNAAAVARCAHLAHPRQWARASRPSPGTYANILWEGNAKKEWGQFFVQIGSNPAALPTRPDNAV